MISETETGLLCAQAVRRYQESIGKPWSCTDDEARKRLMQCINGTAGRHFEIDWYPIVLRVVVFHGGEDLVEPILAEERYRGRREREDSDHKVERVRIHRVASPALSKGGRA